MKETFSFTVRRPIRPAFELLTDLRALAELGQGQVRVSPVTGKPGTGPGSALMIHLPLPGVSEVLCETLEWEEPTRCVRRFDIPDLPATLAMSLKELEEGKTEVTLEIELTPKSAIYKMMMPLLAQKIRQQTGETAEQLKKRLS